MKKQKTKKMIVVVPIDKLQGLHLAAAKDMKSVNQWIVERAIEAMENKKCHL